MLKVLDSIPYLSDKLEIAKWYGEVYPDKNNAMFTSLFPLYRYHSRWSELNAQDFDFAKNSVRDWYTKGSFITQQAIPSTNVTDMNRVAEDLVREREAITKEYKINVNEQHYDNLRYNPSISEKNAMWLDKIRDLCRQHSAELVLVKIPVVQFPQYYWSAWPRQISEIAKTFAHDHQLKFYDLLYDYEVGLDSTTDFWDGGYHLNTLGAEKVTNVLEKIILENLPNAERKVVKQYEDSLVPYHKMMNTVRLQTRTDFVEYLNFLRENLDKYLIAVSVCDDARSNLRENERKALTALGLRCDFM